MPQPDWFQRATDGLETMPHRMRGLLGLRLLGLRLVRLLRAQPRHRLALDLPPVLLKKGRFAGLFQRPPLATLPIFFFGVPAVVLRRFRHVQKSYLRE